MSFSLSMEEGTELHDATVKELPPCKYGDQCYRRNPDHLLKFSHGKNISFESMTSIGSDDKFIEQVGIGTESTSDTAAAETPKDDRIIILMLVGVPGSGKSTFCSALLQDAQSYWIRVCQDVVANGKRGTKEQCLKQVRSALLSSKNVLIDRCNVSKEQRNMFVAFGKEANVEMHALVLALPAGLCIRRAMQRTSHEGDLQGKKVGAVVQRMAQDMEMPSLDEGFVRITVCRKESDVERALLLYKNIEAVKRLPHGFFDDGQNNSKGTLKHFLQTSKSNPPVEFKKSTGNNISQNSFIQHGRLEREENIGSAGDRTLAFPSISTADFQFDHEKAADIIVDCALHFLSKKENQALRLVFVDLFANSDMLLRVSNKAVAVGLDGKRFLTFVGDITRLHSMGGPACHIIANAANWRLKSGGGGVNLAIFKAAGPEFEQATKNRAKVLNPGSALIVPVPNSSPLYLTEGVTHVIHVLGPNMNPRRPNYLNGDYVQGCQVLRETYNCLFESFASLARRSITNVSGDTPNMQGSSNEITGGQEDNHMGCEASKDCYTSSEPVKTFGNMSLSKKSPAPNAFTILMQSAKRKSSKSGTADLKRGKNFDGEVDTSINKDKHGEGSSSDGMDSSGLAEVGSIRAPVDHAEPSGTGIKWPAWAQALYNIALHPEEHQKTLLQITNEAVVMPDLYPKARKHILVLARADGLNSIGDLTREHLPLLRHMHSLGEGWISKFWKEDPSLFFRLGYHWMPSMRQLHLHVVSQDFDSLHLKNKKHWNSFTTIFFRDSKNVILEIEEHGKVKQCNKEMEELLLSQELRCHRCKSAHPNIPRLKNHIASCTKPFSLDIPILSYKEFSST